MDGRMDAQILQDIVLFESAAQKGEEGGGEGGEIEEVEKVDG